MPESDPASSTPSAPPDKRPWMILGRLTKAVREQNWFAVALELAIVVAGVVIGFQVTVWGQARSDRAKEQTYLHQLASDTERTLDVMADAEAALQPADRATNRLVRAFVSAESPPQDSVLLWLTQAHGRFAALPGTGTVQALVATGDLSLIRDDSLRQELVAYLGFTQAMMRYADKLDTSWEEAADRLGRISNWGIAHVDALPRAAVDSMAKASPYAPIPEGPRRTLPPLDTESLVRDPAFYSAVYEMNDAKTKLSDVRRWVSGYTRRLRQLIDAELTP